MFRKIGFWLSLVIITSVKAATDSGSVMTLYMNVPRAGHTISLLRDGNVLITGGCTGQGCDNQLTASAEIYNAASGKFVETMDMHTPRVGHRAVTMPSGEVYIFGGWAGSDATALIEKFNPLSKTFEPAGHMHEARDGFTATLLPSGKVLITGGYHGTMKRLSSAELYDPVTNTSTSIAPMHEARMAHSASLLANGQVLLAGGSKSRGQVLSSAEIFDPETQTFLEAGNLSTPRHKHAAVTLQDGDVLIIGGSGASDFQEQYASIERFDHKTLSFQQVMSMRHERFKIPDAVTLMDDMVVIAGASPEIELYHAATNTRLEPQVLLGETLFYSAVVNLHERQTLITGGYTRKLAISNKAWLYTIP